VSGAVQWRIGSVVSLCSPRQAGVRVHLPGCQKAILIPDIWTQRPGTWPEKWRPRSIRRPGGQRRRKVKRKASAKPNSSRRWWPAVTCDGLWVVALKIVMGSSWLTEAREKCFRFRGLRWAKLDAIPRTALQLQPKTAPRRRRDRVKFLIGSTAWLLLVEGLCSRREAPVQRPKFGV